MYVCMCIYIYIYMYIHIYMHIRWGSPDFSLDEFQGAPVASLLDMS